MTLTDELKILDDKIKANQAQYDLDTETAKTSALSSKELDKYEYLTGEDLGYEPGAGEKFKFEYSPLVEALKNNKSKSKTDKIVKTGKGNKYLVYNQQHSFAKFKDISDFKEMLLDSMRNKLNEFHKKFTRFRNVCPQTKKNEGLKEEVLDNAGHLFNELHYVYKERNKT